eukprot:4748803-Amphidinium_carterae.1
MGAVKTFKLKMKLAKVAHNSKPKMKLAKVAHNSKPYHIAVSSSGRSVICLAVILGRHLYVLAGGVKSEFAKTYVESKMSAGTEVKPSFATVVPHEDRLQDQVQRQATPLACNQ